MRKSEALDLTWNDLNLKENELSISKAIGRSDSSRLYLKSMKTGSSRSIKLDEETILILKEWKRIQKQEYLVLGHNTMKANQLIFSNSKKTNLFNQFKFKNGCIV